MALFNIFNSKQRKLEKISKISHDSAEWLAFKIYAERQGLMPLEEETDKFLGMFIYMVAGVAGADLAQDFLYSQTKDYTPEYRNMIEEKLNNYYQQTKEIADSCMEERRPLDDIIVRFVDFYLKDSILEETPETRADLFGFFFAIYDLLGKV